MIIQGGGGQHPALLRENELTCKWLFLDGCFAPFWALASLQRWCCSGPIGNEHGLSPGWAGALLLQDTGLQTLYKQSLSVQRW